MEMSSYAARGRLPAVRRNAQQDEMAAQLTCDRKEERAIIRLSNELIDLLF